MIREQRGDAWGVPLGLWLGGNLYSKPEEENNFKFFKNSFFVYFNGDGKCVFWTYFSSQIRVPFLGLETGLLEGRVERAAENSQH